MVGLAGTEFRYMFCDNQFKFKKTFGIKGFIVLFIFFIVIRALDIMKMNFAQFIDYVFFTLKLVLVVWGLFLFSGFGIRWPLYSYIWKHKYIQYITEIDLQLSIVLLNGETYELNYADITMRHSNNRCWITDKTGRTYVFSNYITNKNNVAWWKEDGKRYYAFAYVLELIEGKIKSAKQG